jgi:methylisocitrate lyase
MIAALIQSKANAYGRFGARLHDVRHPAWASDHEILIGDAGDRIAFLTLPKAETAADAERTLDAIGRHAAPPRARTIDSDERADRDAFRCPRCLAHCRIAGIVSLDFGTLDFVSAHHGAIPLAAMESPGQFDHALVRRAKAEVASAALAYALVPAHGVTRALDDPETSTPMRGARATNRLFCGCGAFIRRRSTRSLRALSPDAAEIDEAAPCSSLRKRRIGRRCASPASCTIARRIAIAGACCSAHARRGMPSRSAELFRVHAHRMASTTPGQASARRRRRKTVASRRRDQRLHGAAWPSASASKRCICRAAASPQTRSACPTSRISTLDDVLIDVRRITDVATLPLLVDYRHRLGARVQHRAHDPLDDQGGRRRRAHGGSGRRQALRPPPGKEVVSKDGNGRSREARRRRAHDPSFVIMARTDALAVEGIDAAIERASATSKRGADMIFPEAITELAMYKRFRAGGEVPILANITEFGQTPLFTTDELRSADVDIALYCCSATAR